MLDRVSKEHLSHMVLNFLQIKKNYIMRYQFFHLIILKVTVQILFMILKKITNS